MDIFWSSGHYWTTRQPGIRRHQEKIGIKIAYSSKTEWFIFIFSKFHRQAIDVFRSLEKGEVWFHQEPINQFKSFNAWCIQAKHFKAVLAQLRALSDVEIEYVIPQIKQELYIPTPFRDMELQFFEVGKRC